MNEHLSGAFGTCGPVITVGEPDAKKRLMGGPVRLYLGDEVWRAGVIYLMSISQRVVIRAGTAQGTLWELGVARRILDPGKLVIAVADQYHHNGQDPTYNGADAFYRDFKAYAEPVMGCELPRGRSMLIGFDENWEPLVLDKPGRAWPAKAFEREVRRQAYRRVDQIKASLARLYESYLGASKSPEDPYYSRDYFTWLHNLSDLYSNGMNIKTKDPEAFAAI